MGRILIFILLGSLICFSAVGAQDRPVRKPYVLKISGACSPHELSVEYFITGPFGGYASFIRTDLRLWYFEIPTSHDGKPADSLKLTIKGARCRTQTFDFPDLTDKGFTIEAKMRRTRSLEFTGRILSPERLPEKRPLVTAEYWAHWKCEYLGLVDCMIGPLRISSVEVGSDGSFKVRLPDMANDSALSAFSNKGAFQFFVRNKKTGEIIQDLRPESNRNGSREIPIASSYAAEQVFVIDE